MISLRRHTLTKILIILIIQLCLVKNESAHVSIEEISTTSAIQLPNNENITSYSPETTKSTTNQPASSSLYPTTTTRIDYIKEILKEKTNNLNQIYEQLRKQQAEQCAYGEDPMLSDLCPQELLNAPAYSSIPQLATIRLKDVKDRILDKTVLDNLEQVCPIGEWCLEYDILSLEKHRSEESGFNSSTNATLGLTFLQNQQLFCMIQSCFNNIKYYAEKCVKSNLTLNMIKLAPNFCNYNIENNENEYCTENTLRLLHVSAAFSEINEKTNPTRTIDVG